MTPKRALIVSMVAIVIAACAFSIVIPEGLPRERLFVAFVVVVPIALAVTFFIYRHRSQFPLEVRKVNKGPNIIVYIGLALEFFGLNAPTYGSKEVGMVGVAISIIIGIPIFIWGCIRYSKAKGYSAWLGALGLLSLPGLLVLMVIPDRSSCLEQSHPTS